MSRPALSSYTTLRGRRLLFARTAWFLIATLALILFAASIPVYVSNALALGQATWMGAPVEAPAGLVFVLDLVGVLASITAVLVCLTLAGVLFWSRSDEWMIIFVSAYLLLYGSIMAGPLERAETFYPGWPSLAIDVVQPLFFTTPTVALMVLFPNGRFIPPWTRWLIVVSIPLSVAMIYQPYYSWGLVGFMVVGAMYAQIHRYRRVSTPIERQQTKLVLFGILLWLMLMGVLSVPYSIEMSLPSGSPLPWWALVTSTGWWLTLTILPLSLSIAILRYRLYDIDVLINRTLVYGSLTASLVALYFGGIVLLQRLFVALTGERSTLAVVASTLLIAALFNPLRRRIQAFIDRRFYRRKYDARKTLETFSEKLRGETDLEGLREDLLGVVREAMQPAHVRLWLRPNPERGGTAAPAAARREASP